MSSNISCVFFFFTIYRLVGYEMRHCTEGKKEFILNAKEMQADLICLT